MNKIKIGIISTIVVIIAVITAVIIYIQKQNDELQNQAIQIAEEDIEDECTDEYEQLQGEIKQTNSQEEKISPNAALILKREYKTCGHTTTTYQDIPEELVNLTQEQLEEKYPDWKVEQFLDTQVVLLKEEEGSCNEHYMVRQKDGRVAIYEVLEDGTEKEYEITDISTEYLTQTDKINIENGIEVNGKQNLNQLIEDFE